MSTPQDARAAGHAKYLRKVRRIQNQNPGMTFRNASRVARGLPLNLENETPEVFGVDTDVMPEVMPDAKPNGETTPEPVSAFNHWAVYFRVLVPDYMKENDVMQYVLQHLPQVTITSIEVTKDKK